MQNTIQKFRQSSIVFEKPGFLSEKLKTLTSSNYHRVQYIFRNFVHVSYLSMSTKGCSRFFFFCLDLQLLQKSKRPGFDVFVFLIAQGLNKIKNPEHHEQIWEKYLSKRSLSKHTCSWRVNLIKNIKLYGSWNSPKFSFFQTNSLVSRR